MKECTIAQKVGRCFVAVLLAFGLAFSTTALTVAPAQADETAVRDTANGVFRFNWTIDGKDYSRGSCFLINDDTVITGYHCTFFSQNELELYGYSGQSVSDLRGRMTYSVNVNRDVKVGATLINASEEQDFAIFKLDQVINNRTPLTFRDSAGMQATDKCYSIGFPANNDISVINTYTASDATINSGTVVKPQQIIQGIDGSLFVVNGYYVQTDCKLSGGDSGGPMVDANGYVFGISLLTSSSNYYYAAAADYITNVLSDLGIEYKYTEIGKSSTSSSSTSTSTSSATTLSKSKLKSAISEAEDLDASKYTSASYDKVEAALAKAEEAYSLDVGAKDTTADIEEKQDQIDEAASGLASAIDGLEEKTAFPVAAIVGIVIAIIAIVVIVVIVVRKKKNKAPADETNPYQPQEPSSTMPVQATATNASPLPPTTEVGETTMLEEDSSDTVILFQAASGGTLTRMSNNEHIPINKEEFTIGRERSKVDYCLEGNNSISRIHVRLVIRGGKTYLIDNRAANGTYVNGVKLRSGEESLLKPGDIITLADEKFKYSN